jgi:hypothetical protein
MENKPRISKWIGLGYMVLTLAIVILFSSILIFAQVSLPVAIITLAIVMIAVVILLLVIVLGFYSTKYVLKDGRLHSWSPFAVIDIPIKDISKVEQTRIPLYFKGYGASLYSGRFYIPAVGWTKVIITNLTDGILIRAKDGKNYLITPSNPAAFAKALK